MDGAQTNQSKETDVTYHQEEMHRKIQLAAGAFAMTQCGMRVARGAQLARAVCVPA